MTNEVCSRRALRHNPSMSDLIFLLRTFGVADAGQDQLARAYDATLVGQVNDQRGLLAPGLAPQSLDVRAEIGQTIAEDQLHGGLLKREHGPRPVDVADVEAKGRPPSRITFRDLLPLLIVFDLEQPAIAIIDAT